MNPKTEAEKFNTLKVRLNGADYSLRGDISVSRMEEIVALVSEKIDGIKDGAPGLTPVRVAMLAALQLASDVLDLRDDNNVMLAEMQSVALLRSVMASKKQHEVK